MEKKGFKQQPRVQEQNDNSSIISEEDSLNETNEKDAIKSDIEKLKQSLAAKSKEIGNLHILLESVEMLPGISIEKYQKMIASTTTINNNNGKTNDIKDEKIISLSKKIRQLTVQANKLNGMKEQSVSEFQELFSKYEQLQQKLEKQSHEIINSPNRSEIDVKLQKDLNSCQKQIDDLKRKNSQLNDEIKNLNRVLRSELGDNITIDQAMENGWKGRAQQISLLKTKLLKYGSSSSASIMNGSIYEGGNGNSIIAGSISGLSTIGGTSTTRHSKLLGYQPTPSIASSQLRAETRVLNDIAELSIERKTGTDNVVLQRDSLLEQVGALEHKSKGYKARILTLEKECNQFKQQLQILLNKATTDDELIEALKEEMHRLQSLANANNHLRLPTNNMSTSSNINNQMLSQTAQSPGGFNGSNNNSNHYSSNPTSGHAIESGGSDMQELIRLKRLCKQQTDQLETQDDLIRELRSKTVHK